ncbi:hypothetical protein D3C83_12750 [compost metagenome]
MGEPFSIPKRSEIFPSFAFFFTSAVDRASENFSGAPLAMPSTMSIKPFAIFFAPPASYFAGT